MIAEKVVTGFGAYGEFVSGWGSPLVAVLVDDTSIVDDLVFVFAALCKPHSTHIELVAENEPLKGAMPVQFFFTWRIWTFCMSVCRRMMKLVVIAVCLFILCVSIPPDPSISKRLIYLVLLAVDEYLRLCISYRLVWGECEFMCEDADV